MVFFHHSISVTHHFKIPHPFSTITHLPSLNIFHIVCGIHTCHSVQYFFFFPLFFLLSLFFSSFFFPFSFFFSLFAFLISDFSSRSKLNIHKYILEQTKISQSLKKKKKKANSNLPRPLILMLLLWLWWVLEFLRNGTSETIGCYCCCCRNLGTSEMG